MGGRGRSRTQRKHFRQSRENVWKRSKSDDATPDGDAADSRNPGWEPFATQNPAFDEYYKEQEIVSADEWDTFIEYLRKPLPAAFRINSSSQFYEDIRSQLENDFLKSLQAEDTDGNEVEAIKPLPWYPNNLAWQSNFSRNQLRKNQTLARFHEFLKLENEIGNITRQEAVSMVIANDLDVQRCNLLIHQTKRMCTANLIVTNHEAQHFPSCHLHRKHSVDSQNGNIKEPGISQLQFDRVLCDVPCSGDGTLRKAPDIWRKWNAGNGNGLHGLQVQIAMRGVALLKVGGRMIYSTCSMNPVENEAVVAEVRDRGLWLTSCNDVPKYRRSVITPSMFPSGNLYAEIPEHERDTETGHLCENVDSENGLQSTDASVTPSNSLEAEISELPLERCMRIVPHDQNSGAFFIAIFHKVSSLTAPSAIEKKCKSLPEETDCSSTQPQEQMNEVKENSGDDIDLTGGIDVQISEPTPDAELLDTGIYEAPLDADQNKMNQENEKEEDTEPSPDVETDAKMVTGKRKLQIQGRWRGVDPVIFYKDDTVVGRIMEFYGIKDSFPFKGHLITRNDDTNHVKRIYYVSNSVKEVLELNFLAGQQLKIASVGLKMFERQTSKEGTSAPCLFRISSEGLPLILPHITKQILYATPVDFKHLLQYKVVKFSDFVNPDVGEKATQLMLGCCVVFLSRENHDSSQDVRPIAIGCWRGRTNIAVMVTSIDCQELLEWVSMLLSTGEAEQSKGDHSIPEVGEEGKSNSSEI
ncbi:tRNA (cytosine(34)-c(5))-methyltransferase [Phtheirospermum japonicum]|uniref:tRNA (Cytosine(34)-c(5))-methyltransferase n=1 Tax=Phtheirospermum japonicum TaxID=374723 RepID=A0A830C285_9LAMI|nr:tRNA (cytosine(34)-c(5))-methyltransferase [Phtheirospermum japonicum]